MVKKAEFKNYGGKEDFHDHEEKKFSGPNDVQGGDINPYGDMEKKEKSAIDMNAGEAFNKKDFTKVDAMGTEAPKKSGKPGQFEGKVDKADNCFSTETENSAIDPFGTDCGKTKSFQSRH
jgi:hypothetical protein